MNFLALPEISPLLSSTGGHNRHAAHPCGTNSTRALVATALPGSDRAEQSKPRSSTGSHRPPPDARGAPGAGDASWCDVPHDLADVLLGPVRGLVLAAPLEPSKDAEQLRRRQETGRDPMYGNRRSSNVQTALLSVLDANGCFASHSRAIASTVLEPLARSARLARAALSEVAG